MEKVVEASWYKLPASEWICRRKSGGLVMEGLNALSSAVQKFRIPFMRLFSYLSRKYIICSPCRFLPV